MGWLILFVLITTPGGAFVVAVAALGLGANGRNSGILLAPCGLGALTEAKIDVDTEVVTFEAVPVPTCVGFC